MTAALLWLDRNRRSGTLQVQRLAAQIMLWLDRNRRSGTLEERACPGDSMLWDDIDKTQAEIRRLLPILKENGGYIFQEDHSIPDSVRLQDFRRIVELAKELGTY